MSSLNNMDPTIYDLARRFFGFGEEPPRDIEIVLPTMVSTLEAGSKRDLECANYPSRRDVVSVDDVYSALRVHSLLTGCYGDRTLLHLRLSTERPHGLSGNAVLIGGPPTNKWTEVATEDCPIHFSGDEGKKRCIYVEEKRYEIDFRSTGNAEEIRQDYCLLSKKTLPGGCTQFVIAGLRAFGQKSSYLFLGEKGFYNHHQVKPCCEERKFQILVKVPVAGDDYTAGWDVEAVKRPPYNVDPRAFVSYIREDSARVDILSNELRSRDIGVLRDTTHIEVATDWRHRIANMIQDAHAFVLCCSQGAIDKNDTYMREEIRQAVERSRTLRPDVKWIIPIRLDGCNVSTLLRAHDLNISSLTWIDWLDNNDTRAIDAVANAIREAHQGHREQGR